MSVGAWVLIGVGAAQAVFLAVAAYYAWRTFQAAQLEPIVRELQTLVQYVEQFNSTPRGPKVLLAEALGQQQRLGVALDLVFDPLPQTRLVARLPKNGLLEGGQLLAARAELQEYVAGVRATIGRRVAAVRRSR
jgi:hypothetical protein